MKTLFTMSFLVAVAAFVGPFIIGPWVFRNYGGMDSATHVSFLLAMCWLVLLVVALLRLRRRGLWLLTGLPFAFYWPYVFLEIASNCAHNVRNCP